MSTQNDHIARSLTCADRVAYRLMRLGFTVINIQIAEASPRIEVLPCKACKQLEQSINVVIEHGPRGVRRKTKTARVDGALIQWREPA